MLRIESPSPIKHVNNIDFLIKRFCQHRATTRKSTIRSNFVRVHLLSFLVASAIADSVSGLLTVVSNSSDPEKEKFYIGSSDFW